MVVGFRCFYMNAEAFGVLLSRPVIRLAPDDTQVVTNMDANVGGSLMNSFTLTAVGNLARNPEAVAKGEITYTRFCLVGNDRIGKDDEGAPREIVTSLWFVAFGPLGESLMRSARKGDQLIVDARVRANNWTDKQGEKQYDLDFVVQGFRFGAPGKLKREERDAARREERASNSHSNSEPVPMQSQAVHDSAAANASASTPGASSPGTSNPGTSTPSGASSAEKPSGSRGRRSAASPT
jgi:single-strand DNA-binding protein